MNFCFDEVGAACAAAGTRGALCGFGGYSGLEPCVSKD